MAQTLEEQIRIWMQRIEETAPSQPQQRSYDLEIEVENWEYSDNENDPNWKPERTLGINYSIYGQDRPARINYDDYDHPAEHAEIDEVEVFDVDTGQPLPDLPKYIDDAIIEAIWEDVENRKNNDDYDPYD